MSAARQPSPPARAEAAAATAPVPAPAAATDPAAAAPAPAPVQESAGPARAPRARLTAAPRGVRPAPALDGEERARLLEGRHHDPHAVLGARTQRGGVAFRVLRPYAKAVTVVAKGLRAELFDDGDGLFSGLLPLTGVPEYRLLVAYGDDEIEIHDPYRFLPALGELDLHLIGEGRHEELWTARRAPAKDNKARARNPVNLWAPKPP
ncbi:1,4-alpha-glucan branching enzyme, partial [Streptomyces goshikiensis]